MPKIFEILRAVLLENADQLSTINQSINGSNFIGPSTTKSKVQKGFRLYLSGFWATLKLPQNNPLEVFHLKFCQKLLGVQT